MNNAEHTATIVVNDLESDRFGIRFARLNVLSDDLNELDRMLADADAAGIHVISARVNTMVLATMRTLEEAGFRLMDTLVYHRRTLSPEDTKQHVDPACGIVELLPPNADACAAIAMRSFQGYVGHYHADPRLDDTAATEAYADWIRRLVKEPAGEQIALAACARTALTGFIAGLRRGPRSSEIVLNAVDPAAQRGGIYSALLRSYLAHASARGDNEVIISTQLQNTKVQRIWSREGFLLSHSAHTLHRWAPSFFVR